MDKNLIFKVDHISPELFIQTEREYLAAVLTRLYRYTNTSLPQEERREIALKKARQLTGSPEYSFHDNALKVVSWDVDWTARIDTIGEELEAANITMKVSIDEPRDQVRVTMVDGEFIGVYGDRLYYLHRMPAFGAYEIVGIGSLKKSPQGHADDTVTIAIFKEGDSPSHGHAHTNGMAWDMAQAFLGCEDNSIPD